MDDRDRALLAEIKWRDEHAPMNSIASGEQAAADRRELLRIVDASEAVVAAHRRLVEFASRSDPALLRFFEFTENHRTAVLEEAAEDLADDAAATEATKGRWGA